MKFNHWENPRGKNRIYVNGLKTFNGKVFFEKNRTFIKIIPRDSIDPVEIERIYSEIEKQYGVQRDTDNKEIIFDVLYEKIKDKGRARVSPRTSFSCQNDNLSSQEEDVATVASIKIPEMINIVIDHREPDELVNLLDVHPMITVAKGHLELGDILINASVLIERKQCTNADGATDFKNSIVNDDKRLFNQSERLKLQEDYIPIILLEGKCYQNTSGMMVQQIDGAISFLSIIQRLSVLTTYNLKHTAYMIAKLGTHHRSGLGYEIALRSKKPEMLLDRKAFILEGISGVSATTAKLLIEHFDSVKNVINATEKELLEIKGIGPKIVKKIMSDIE